MANPDKSSRSGFVIKLTSETAQKLAEEEQHLKVNTEELTDVKQSEEPNQNINPDIDFSLRNKINSDTGKPAEIFNNSIQKDSTTAPVSCQIPKKSSDTTNESWGEYSAYVTYQGEQAIYTDPTSKQEYAWNQESNKWDKKDNVSSRVYSYENDTHIYTEADGSKFFWDQNKKAWIPKVDDDFLAYYQMSYGFVENKPEEKKEESKLKEAQKKSDSIVGVKRKNEPQWFEQAEEKNTKVYVSNLPLDLTEEEFVNFMQKCGLVERCPSTQKMKVKLYVDKEQNCFKGDALCTYIKIESVDLALNLLDGSDLKGNKVKVEKAQFELKGQYNPALKPKKKKKKELEKIKKMQQKLFDWRPEKFIGEKAKHERVVIVKNLFQPSDFDNEVQLILDYQQDLRDECGKSGEVRKVVLYDRHPEGVAQITMKEPEQADAVVELINGRWFGKRQITAEIWDGRTKYKIAETDADINRRMDKWGKFLEEKEDSNVEPGSIQTSENSTEVLKTISNDKDTLEDLNQAKESSSGEEQKVSSEDTVNTV